MAELDNSFTNKNGDKYIMIDNDTIYDVSNDRKVRLGGFDGFETSKIVRDEKTGLRQLEAGEIGGEAQTQAVLDIIKKGGFTNLSVGDEIDDYGRYIGSLSNDDKKDLVRQLYASGVADVNNFTSDANAAAKRDSEILNELLGGEHDPYGDISDKYQDAVRDAAIEQGTYYKTTATDEKSYDPDYHYGVGFRHDDRYLNNKAKGIRASISASFGQGWEGIKEGLWGYADALGQTTGIEMLENLGEEGVRRSHFRMSQAPQFITNYKEIEDISTGFQWVLNNASMSAPYMIGTFGAMAATIPMVALGAPAAVAVGLTQLPIALVYAGQTWNEMEGDKGVNQFLAASTSGVMQSTFERLGIAHVLSAPMHTLKASGKAKVIRALKAENPGMTSQEANILLKKVLISEQANYAKGLTKLSPDDLSNFAGRDVAKAIAAGSVTEGTTEILQEGTQMATAALASDTRYTSEEVKDRLINAGLAGGVLGGGIGGASNIHKQAKHKMLKEDIRKGRSDRRSIIERFRMGLAQKGQTPKTMDEVLESENQITNQKDPNNPEGRETKTVYDKNGNAIEVIDIGNNKQVQVKGVDANGQYNGKILELNKDVFEKSIYDNDIEVKVTKNLDSKKEVNKFSDTEIENRLSELRKIVNNDKVSDEERETAQRDVNALVFEQQRRNGVVHTRPAVSNEWKGFSKNDSKTKGIFTKLHDGYKETQKGVVNYFKQSESLHDYVSNAWLGFTKLFVAAERNMMPFEEMIKSMEALDLWSRVGGVTSSPFHSGRNFKEWQDDLIKEFKVLVDENQVANLFGYKYLTHKNVVEISKQLWEFGRSGKFELFQDYWRGETGAFNEINNYSKVLILEKNIKDVDNQITYHSKKGNIKVVKNLEKKKKDLENSLADYKTLKDNNITIEDANIPFNVLMRKFGFKSPKEVVEYWRRTQERINANEVDADGRFDIDKELTTSVLDAEGKKQKASLGPTQDEFNKSIAKYASALQIKNSYDAAYDASNSQYLQETGKELYYDPNYWYRHQGFDYKKVRRDPNGFKNWLRSLEKQGVKSYTENEIDRIYEQVSRDGLDNINEEFSLIAGKHWMPYTFSELAVNISNTKGFSDWSSDNIFETLNKTQLEAGKYASTIKYFGAGGWKLDKAFKEMSELTNAEGKPLYTEKQLQQFAYYMKSMIDSAHGNFNRIENPRWAAVNKYLTGWTIMSGLPLSAIASAPETAMIYFNIKDDAQWKQASETFIKEIAGAFTSALDSEVKKSTKLVRQVGLEPNQNTVVDRFATGQRDVSFLRMHETFFRAVGISQITHFQRKINAAFGIDFIRSNFDILNLAPKKKYTLDLKYAKGTNRVLEGAGDLDMDNLSEVEMRAYNELVELGIEPQRLLDLISDVDENLRDSVFEITDSRPLINPDTGMAYDTSDWLNSLTGREQAFKQMIMREGRRKGTVPDTRKDSLIQHIKDLEEEINDMITTGLYRFVNERVQLPGAQNRPLFFQDPHYQLITQFNGFISAFTANVIPKLYARGLAKGTVKVKYDTFSLILTMIALGSASQYLKDLIKFGKASPYLDMQGYVQRAVYASGAMGQYERLVDVAYPLYPDRDEGIEWLANAVLGEAGPAARNIQNVLTGTQQIMGGDTERGVSNLMRTAPYIAPATEVRHRATDVVHLKNPLKDEIGQSRIPNPDKQDIINWLLG